MNFSKSALFAALTAAALGSTAVTGFTVSGPSTFAVVKSSSSTTKLYQANEPQQQEQEEDIDSDSSSSSNDIQTMSYIENVARFCNQMGYSLDEYEAMVGELQEQHSFLEKRSGTIERLLSGLEWHENTPVDLHDPEAVFKLKTALEMVLEVEGLDQFKPDEPVGPWYFVDSPPPGQQLQMDEEEEMMMEMTMMEPHLPLEPPPESAFFDQEMMMIPAEELEFNRQMMEYNMDYRM